MAKITPKKKGKEGYVRTLMRWRENADNWGSAPPATESMVREGAAFSLEVQSKKVGMRKIVWENHREYMRETYDHAYLKQFHLDYLTMAEWEKA